MDFGYGHVGRLQRIRICATPGAANCRRQCGQAVSVLQEAFGEPRKIDKTSTKLVYVWFLPQKPKEGAPSDSRAARWKSPSMHARQRVLGYSLSNIGWSACRDVQRRIRVAQR